MKCYKLTEYSLVYKEKLKDFLKKHNPTFTDKFIDYLVENAWDEKHERPAVIVVDENDEIVGEHLYFYTKAIIHGEERSVSWGHDTFLCEEARAYAGLDFVLATDRKDGMGLGISEINRKILKKRKNIHLLPMYRNFYFNLHALWGGILRCFHIKQELNMPRVDVIKIKSNRFERVDNIGQMRIPSQGYWGQGKYDIEFVRDADFLRKRFFENPIHQYNVYRYVSEGDFDEMYFVVRPIFYRGFKALHLVDFRYNPNKLEQIRFMVKALKKLSCKCGCDILHVVTSDMKVPQELKGWRWLKRDSEDFVIPKYCEFKGEKPWVIATSADSDGEYHYWE